MKPITKKTNSKPVTATYDGKPVPFGSLRDALKNYGLEKKYSQYAGQMNIQKKLKRPELIIVQFDNGLTLKIERP